MAISAIKMNSDAVDVEGYRFQVTGVDGRRVSQVRIQRSRAPKKTS